MATSVPSPPEKPKWDRLRQDPHLALAVMDLTEAVHSGRVNEKDLTVIPKLYAGHIDLPDFVDDELGFAIDVFVATCVRANIDNDLVARVVRRFRQATVPAHELREEFHLPERTKIRL